MAHRCPITVEEYHAVVYAAWRWIIQANNGHGSDVGDLMQALEEVDAGCPVDLDENGDLITTPWNEEK